jgi:hypothetical protein
MMVVLETKAKKAQLVMLGLLDHLAAQDSMENQVWPSKLGHLEKLALRGRKGQQVLLVKMAHLVKMARKAQKVIRAKEVQKVQKEQKDLKVHLALEWRDLQALLVHKVNLGHHQTFNI